MTTQTFVLGGVTYHIHHNSDFSGMAEIYSRPTSGTSYETVHVASLPAALFMLVGADGLCREMTAAMERAGEDLANRMAERFGIK